MMCSSRHLELLDIKGMSRAHLALKSKFEWFGHATDVANLASVRKIGLRPQRTKHVIDLPDEILNTFGSLKFICLNPLGALEMNLPPGVSRVKLAVHQSNLPSRIGLDWSYPPSWTALTSRGEILPHVSTPDLFVYVVDTFGSVVCYDPLPPNILRVCTSDSPDPLKWAPLPDATEAEIRLFFTPEI